MLMQIKIQNFRGPAIIMAHQSFSQRHALLLLSADKEVETIIFLFLGCDFRLLRSNNKRPDIVSAIQPPPFATSAL
jgi:hypothetical protein